jgi:outer membrane receptor protein involved in Fe transport
MGPRLVAALLITAASLGPGTRAAAAGDDGEGDEPISLEALADLVVTATLRVQPTLEAPASITVVSASEIRARGYRTLKAIMNDVPGFEDVSDANEETVAVRGVYASTTNKIVILVNGHRMNDLMLGRYNVDQFLGMEAVERVEFIRGPASALYGTGALVGVVNVITKRGPELDGTQARVQAGRYAQEASLSWGKASMGYDLFFNFTYLDALGQTLPQPARLDAPPPGQPARAGSIYLGRYRENMSSLFTARSDHSTLAVRAAHFRRSTPRGSNGSFYDYDAEDYKPTYTENDFFADYSHRWALGDSGRTELTVNPSVHFFSYFEQSYVSYGADRVAPAGERAAHQDEFVNYQLKLTLEHRAREDLNLIAGLDGLLASFFRSDAVSVVDGKLVLIPRGNTTTGRWLLGGTFVQAVYSPTRPVSLTLGARYDTFQNEADPKVTPRLGVVYQPLAGLAIKALYGRSYLAPMWAHKRANDGFFVGNAKLQPESFEGLDFIVAHADRRGSATVDLFYNRVQGLINSVTMGKQADYENTGMSLYLGSELAGEVQVTRWLRLQGSHSYIRPISSQTSPSLRLGDELKNIPAHILRYGLRLEPMAGLSLSLWGRAQAATRTVDTITGDLRIPAVALFDASATYTFRTVTLQLIANNLTDRHYEIGGTVPRPLARQGLDVQAALLLRL